jgi:hypothetical protein
MFFLIFENLSIRLSHSDTNLLNFKLASVVLFAQGIHSVPIIGGRTPLKMNAAKATQVMTRKGKEGLQ